MTSFCVAYSRDDSREQPLSVFSSVAENLPLFLSSREDLARASKTLIVTRREGGKAGSGSL